MGGLMNSRGGNHARPSWKIPNGVFAPETPQLTEVTVYAPVEMGMQNLEEVMAAIGRFWLDRDTDEVAIPGRCILGGNLYGKHRHKNGEYFYTDEIVTMKRLKRGEPKNTRFPRDILCAETRNGETYFFCGDMFSLYLLLMMGDALDDCLREERGYYQHPHYRSDKYF